MNRIFDALKRVQRDPSVSRPRHIPSPEEERRRSPRWNAHIPIFVYGHGQGALCQPFHEEAYSANVCELGGLLVMTATVRPGQTLLLTNKVTQVAHECRVVHVSGRDPQTIQVAVEFGAAAPDFWHVTTARRASATTPSSAKRKRGG